nr:hypothetical protein [Tanacetum cinerariifolium]
MDAKLAWLLEKYYRRSQTHIGDVYLTAEELHPLHLDEEALRETLEEQIMDEKAREEKIRQKKLMMMNSFWNLGARVEPSSSTPNPVRVIPGPAGTIQLSSSTYFEPSSSTSNPVRIIPGPAGLVHEAWISTTNYVISTGGTVIRCLGDINNFLKKGKLDQVVAIVKSCSPNYFGDLNVTMKDLLGRRREKADVTPENNLDNHEMRVTAPPSHLHHSLASLYLYPCISCRLVILCHHPHAQDLESLLTISPSTYALSFDRFDKNVSFEEEVVHQRLRKTLTHVLELSSCVYLDDRAWGLEF